MSSKKSDDNAEFDELVAASKTNINSELPVKWEKPAPPSLPATMKAAAATKRIRQVAFLKALSECGVVNLACKAVGINVMTERSWRISNDQWYAEQFKIHLQTYRDIVQAEVHDRAINGVETPIVGKKQVQVGKDIAGNPIFGQEDRIIGTKRVKSDLLLMFHAKKVIPEYRDKYEPPKEDDSRIKQTESPLVRIQVKLDMISGRQQQGLIDAKPVLSITSGNSTEIVDITPESEEPAVDG